MKRICVNCGSSPGFDPCYMKMARRLGQALAERGYELIYTELRVVSSMHERKQIMFDLSDGFIALPGGMGTIEEMFEILTWAQLGLHRKLCGMINVCGYFDKLLEFLDHSVDQLFVRRQHRDMLLASTDPDDLLAQFERNEAPITEKWINRK